MKTFLLLFLAVSGENCLKYGTAYHGFVNVTVNGYPCQKWNVDQPHVRGSNIGNFNEDHNYCRNPDKSPGRPWCYTITVLNLRILGKMFEIFFSNFSKNFKFLDHTLDKSRYSLRVL